MQDRLRDQINGIKSNKDADLNDSEHARQELEDKYNALHQHNKDCTDQQNKCIKDL